MSNTDKRGDKSQRRITIANSFGDLVSRALAESPDAKRAYEQLRTTYLKDEYRRVFPSSLFHIEPRSVGAIDSRKRDFRFTVNHESICFVRNLWFIHQFLPPKPRDVLRFFTTNKPEERTTMFAQRFEELKALAGTYDGWFQAAGKISGKLAKFNPMKTDLLATAQATPVVPGATPLPTATQGAAAVADLIREVEQRASYQAGNPDDACEKALYFLALGRPDIGEAIAKEVLAENPDHAIALYTNAVLLVDASERHQKQAFIHDIMHPHDLIPVEAEEQWHADRHAEESLRAWEEESRAFLLMLKARQNWPKKFPIKRYELAPENWRHKVDEWLFMQAAARIGANPATLNLPSKTDSGHALKALTHIVTEIWSKDGKWMFRPFGADFLRRFIIVAAHTAPDVARECMTLLEAALDHRKLDDAELIWRDQGVVLPVSQEPTLPETLIPAVTNTPFCSAVFAVKPKGDGAALLRRIIQAGLNDERDRRTAMRSLAVRAAVLDIARGGDLAQAVALCREMADRHDWPLTETGKTLQKCWRYSVVRLLFEASRDAFDANDLLATGRQVSLALDLATELLPALAGNKPLLVFVESDEDGDTETVGDFLRRKRNIITDACPSDSMPLTAPSGPRKSGWDGFLTWAEKECVGVKSLLLAYSLWLARKHGQEESLLSKCDALAAKLASLTPKELGADPPTIMNG